MGKFAMTAALALILSSGASAQPAWQRFVSASKDSMVSFSCSFTIRSKVAVTGNADVDVQDGKFRLNGRNEIVCDGKTRWTVDADALEVIIESVADSRPEDPALIVGEMERHFKAQSTSRVEVDGEMLEQTVFVPLSGDLGISSMSVTFRNMGQKPPVIVKASVTSKDSVVMDFTFSRMEFLDKAPDSDFVYDMSRADSSWVVTDLR